MNSDIQNRFTFHPATPEQGLLYEEARSRALEFALWMDEHAPASRELSSAITKLDEAVMHFNASVARNS
jgi:hypothetical protein